MTMMDGPTHRDLDPAALRALIAGGLPAAATGALWTGARSAVLAVERVHFPGAKPVQLQFRATGGGGPALIGEWVGADAEALALAEAARLAKPRRGQAADGAAVTALPDLGLLLRRPGFDAKLPGLRLLHDPAFATARLPALGLDPTSGVALVAHRLGKRAVLRIDGPDGIRYARLRPVTSGSGQAAYDRHLALWTALQGGGGLAIPRPLGFDADLGLALFDTLPGTPPVFQGKPGFRAAQAVMQALAGLQALRLDAPPHDAAAELAILDSWMGRTGAVFPDLAMALQGPLARLRQDLAALPPVAPVPCHRDLHEGQILLDSGRAGLLDFDTLRLGDPALDLGNLQAHLVLASLRDGQPRRAFVTAMDNAAPHLPLSRIAVWRRAALLRLAMIYAFSSEPPAVIRGLMDEAG